MLCAPAGSEEVDRPETAFTDPIDEAVDAKVDAKLGTLVQLPDVFVDVPTLHEETEKPNTVFRKAVARFGYAIT